MIFAIEIVSLTRSCDILLQVYILGSATRADNKDVQNELLSIGKQYNGIVLLLDPDVAGRQARNIINAALSDCWHAFIPTPIAQARAAVGYKEIGNIGVEHAAPAAIQAALLGRRMGVEGRKEFNREDLVELGLIAVTQEKASLKNSTVLQIKFVFSPFACNAFFLSFLTILSS